MTGRWSVLLATMTLLACSAPALATVGGPTLLDVLGWDPDARRVYVHFVDTSGGGFFGDVVSFAPDSGAVGVPEPWVRQGENSYADSVLVGKLSELRRRLIPLATEPAAVMPLMSRVVSQDTLRDELLVGQTTRYRVRARWPGQWEAEFEFVTWGVPDVLLKAVHVLPGHAARLFVFAFVGNRMESGYETQVPVIVAVGEKGLRRVGEAEAP